MEKMEIAPDTLSDEEVISRVLNGEKELYEVVMRRYNPRVFRICRAYVRDADDVEDIIQEAYIKAYEELPRFQRRSKFSTWLTRIVINQALGHIKKSKRMGSAASSLPANGEHETRRELQTPVMENPAERAMNEELRNILEQAVDKLPEKYRSVFIMREVEDLSIAETSRCLSITEANVKVRLNRAKEMLKTRIGKVYREAEVYHFDLVRCDRIVANVLRQVKRY